MATFDLKQGAAYTYTPPAPFDLKSGSAYSYTPPAATTTSKTAALATSGGREIIGTKGGENYYVGGQQYTPPNPAAPVSGSQIANGAPLNFPPAGTPDNGAGLVQAASISSQPAPASATPNLDSALSGDYSKDIGYQQAQGQLTESQRQLQTAQNALPSQEQLLSQAETAQGVPQKQQALNDLNMQVAQAVGDYNIASQNAETRGITTGTPAVFYQGESAAIQRQKAVVVGALSARQLAAQGAYDSAEALALRTVDLKFADAQRKVDNIKDLVNMNQENLSRAEKLAMNKLDARAKQEQAKIDEAKANQKSIQSIMIEAARSGADPAMLAKIQGAGSIEEAIGLGGEALGAEFRQKIAQQKFENEVALQRLAISKAELGISQARLSFDKQKEAFDEAMKLNPAGKASPIMQQAVAKAGIDLTTTLLTDKGLNSAVGPNAAARFSILNRLTGVKSNFIAGVEQLRSQLNLQALIDAKAKGATFGALSDQELQVLASTATKIGTWAIKDKNGNIIGYNVDEKSFRKELDKINNFAKLDYVLKGGNPDDVGIKQEPDGTYTTKNSDGSVTVLE